jgi:elongation factor P
VRPKERGSQMISTGELKKGIVIELEGDLWQILEYHHIKVGRGSAQVRIKFRNVRKQSIVEKTFQAGEKFPRATLERRPAQFLFSDGNDYTFMDTSNYDQFVITGEQLGEAKDYIKDNLVLERISYEEETLGVELPINIDLVVKETDPGFAGDTATGARKPATLETGLVVQVPLFVSVGDVIRVDTRTGEYQTRV